MRKPVNKKELLKFSQEGYEDILEFINQLSVKDRVMPWKTSDRDKNLRDLVYHLHAWHRLLKHWLDILLEGGKPILPKEGYSWDDLDDLNGDIWLEAQTYALMDTLSLFEESHIACMQIVSDLSEEQLFTPFFQALHHPIISLVDGCLNDHYQWAMKQLKKEYHKI